MKIRISIIFVFVVLIAGCGVRNEQLYTAYKALQDTEIAHYQEITARIEELSEKQELNNARWGVVATRYEYLAQRYDEIVNKYEYLAQRYDEIVKDSGPGTAPASISDQVSAVVESIDTQPKYVTLDDLRNSLNVIRNSDVIGLHEAQNTLVEVKQQVVELQHQVKALQSRIAAKSATIQKSDNKQESAKTQRAVSPVETKKEDTKADITVYVTRTGGKYHRGSCSYLRRSRIPTTLSVAKTRYSPCSRCSPPR